MKNVYRSGAALLMGFFSLVGVSAHAQQFQILESVSDFRGTPEFIKFDTEAAALPMSRGNDVLAEVLGFTSADELRVDRVVSDQIGFTHERRQQYFQGIPVEYGTFNLHAQKGQIVMANGEFKRIPSTLSVRPALSEDAALQNALNHVGAQKYFELPAGELVIVEDYTAEDRTPRLAFKFNVYAEAPLSRDFIYVDAMDGRVIHTNAIIKHVGEHAHTAAAPAVDLRSNSFAMAPLAAGNADTRYSGTQTIEATLSGGSYVLQGTQNGVSVNTYDCGTRTQYNRATDFMDNDNNWTAAEHANAAKDDGALDAHWGAQMTAQYWATQHGRNSWDGNGAAINSYVHYDRNYDNAFWNGSVMTYGDGSTFDILTSMDVVAHEIGHAVCSSTANLVYSYESGAMNEGFSDIWGACVEAAYKSDDNNPWLIGEEIGSGISTYGPLRSMQDPNAEGHPDTYLGTNWNGTSSDNGGVHTNSGVLNYWFYLLTNGGSGTNDNGDAYSVTGIGITDAAAIAYRLESVYLSANSQFANARTYGIQSATDLFGAGSQQEQSVIAAWDAVGVAGAGGGGGGGGGVEECSSSTDVSGARRTWNYYTLTVPAEALGTSVSTTCDNGDADLYVRWGTNPTTNNYAARSAGASSNESVSVTGSGTLHIGIYAYTPYSGLTLDACNTMPAAITATIGGVEHTITFNGESVEAERFQVWPNPTSGMLSVAAGFDMAEGSTARIISITGQVAMEVAVEDLRNGVDVSGLNNGMYIITVEDSKGNARTQQFIKE